MGFVIHVLVLGMGCVSQNPWNLRLLTFNLCPILRIEHVEPIQLYRADRLTYFGTQKFLGKDRDRSVETQASRQTRSLLFVDQKFEGSMLSCPHSKGSWWRCAARVRHILGTPQSHMWTWPSSRWPPSPHTGTLAGMLKHCKTCANAMPNVLVA